MQVWYLILLTIATFVVAFLVKQRQTEQPTEPPTGEIVFEYSIHAVQRMEERDISQEKVEKIVQDPASKAFAQSGGRLRITDGELTVIAKLSGRKIVIMTVFYD